MMLGDHNVENVILLTVDCLRADQVRDMDTVSDLMASHTEVLDCQCTGSGTPTSMPGIMQSRLPTSHGGKAKAHSLVPTVPTLAEVLNQTGFLCGGWHSNVYTSVEYDYQRGFDVFADLKSDPPDQQLDDSFNDSSVSRTPLLDLSRAMAQKLNIQSQARRVYDALRGYGVVEGLP
jgi:hypothetical protein